MPSGKNELDRPLQFTRRSDCEDLRSVQDCLRSEASAEEGRADQHVIWGDPEPGPIGAPTHDQRLVRHIQRQVVALPLGHDRVRLHGVVELGSRGVVGFDDLRGGSHARVQVAMGRARRRPDTDGRRGIALPIAEPNSGWLDGVFGIQQRSAFSCSLQAFRHDQRDRLVRIADRVVLQHLHPEAEGAELDLGVMRKAGAVRRGEHFDDTGMGLRGGDVQRGHPPTGDLAHRRYGIAHARGVIVSGVGRLTCHLQLAIAPGQRLTCVGTVPAVRCDWGRCVKRHRKLQSRWRKRRVRREGRVSARVFLPGPDQAPAQGCGGQARF